MVAPVPRRAVPVPPPVVGRQQVAQGGQQVVVAAGAGLEDRQPGGGVRHPDVQQARRPRPRRRSRCAPPGQVVDGLAGRRSGRSIDARRLHAAPVVRAPPGVPVGPPSGVRDAGTQMRPDDRRRRSTMEWVHEAGRTYRSPTATSRCTRARIDAMEDRTRDQPRSTTEGRPWPPERGRPRSSATACRASCPTSTPTRPSEWLESLDAVVDDAGRNRARYLMLRLLQRAREKPGRRPQPAQHRLHQHDPAGERAVVPRRRARRAPDPRVRPVERRDHGAPGAAPRRRRRRPHLDLRLLGVVLRGRLQPLLPRQGPPRRRRPDLLPGPRLPRHVRPRVPRGPADRGPARRLPPGALAPGRRAAVLPAPAADAATSGSSRPSRWASARSTRSTRRGSTATCTTAGSRTPASSTSGRSSATARWTSRSRSARSASRPARSSTT